MKIEMLSVVGEHQKGATITVDDAVGEKYVAAGLAKAAPAGDGAAALDNLAETIKTAVAAGFAAGASAFEGKGLSPEERAKRFRIDAGESEEDRTKSFADFCKQLIIVGCPNIRHELPFGNVDVAAAGDRLAKVYGSKFRQSEQKDMYEGSGTTGGFTVAPLYATELLKLAAEESIVRPYANVKVIPGREAYFPMLDQTTAPTAGNTAYYGGVVMQWRGEAAARPSTEPAFKEVHINLHELTGMTKISRTLLSDSMIAMESELRGLFAGAISWTEDYNFLQGNGNAKPRGVLNLPALVTYGSRAASNKFELADAANMMGAMMPPSRPKSVWVMTNNLYPQLVQLVDASGKVTYIPNVGTGFNDARLGVGQSGLLLFGRPCIFTEKLPALGTAGDVLLCDFSKYIVADNGTLEIAASDQYAFNTNQITFRVIKRVDGQSQIDLPFTQQDASTKISPFVALHA